MAVGKEAFVIDTDIHPNVSAERIAEHLAEPMRRRWLAGSRGPGHLGYWNPHGVTRADTVLPDGRKIETCPHALIEHYMDPYGLSHAVLNPGYQTIGNLPDADYAAAVCTALNKVVAEEWLPVSDRLRASICISAQDPHLAAEEIHRAAASHDRFAQILMASGQRDGYGKRCFDPIYKAAESHNLPVAVHPGSEGTGTSGVPTAAGYPSTYFEWHTGLVASYMAHLLSLVCEGTFIKFPQLRFVLIEGGVAWLPPLMWRLDKNWKALRSTTPWLEAPPSTYVYEHVFLTTQPIEEPEPSSQLAQVLGMFPAERMLMFSSDFPHWDGDTPDFVLRYLKGNLRERVMSGTAAELYRISPLSPGSTIS